MSHRIVMKSDVSSIKVILLSISRYTAVTITCLDCRTGVTACPTWTMLVVACILDDGTYDVTLRKVALVTVCTVLNGSLGIMTHESTATATYVSENISKVCTAVYYRCRICSTGKTTHTFEIITLGIRHVLSTVLNKTVVYTSRHLTVQE